MIAGFRKSLRSWATVLLLLLALIAIVVTGFGTDGFGGLGSLGGGTGQSEPLAKVEGVTIEASDVTERVNRAFGDARQQQPTLDMASFLAQGAFEGILKQTVIGQAIRHYADERGLVASERMVDREIVNIPAFRNFTGQFDQASFQAALARERISERRLRDDIANSLIVRQLVGPVALGMRAPQGVAREYASLLLERRRGMIGAIPAAIMAAGINPTDAELARFYRQRRAEFTLPERRVIQYALIGPEQVAAAAAATDAEIAQVYRSSQARFGPRETRTLQHLVLQDRAAAQQAAAQLRGGADFSEVASRLGFAAADLTVANQTRDSFARQAPAEVAAAAFATARGQIAGPVESEAAFHIVRVESIASTPGRTLQEARAEIAAFIEQRKRGDALNALIGRVEDQISEGASFEEAARATGLTVAVTPPITSTGQVVGAGGAAPWRAPPELTAVLATAFEIDAEDPEPVIEQLPTGSRFVLLGLERAEAAAPPPLAQIRDRVRATFVARAAMDRAKAVADGIAARINRGMPAAQAFAEAQPRVPSVERVDLQRLQISRSGQEVPPPLITLFSIPQGRARVLRTPANNGWFIVAHEQRTAGDAATNQALIATTRAEFNRTAGEELAQQFARAIELRTRIERDPAAIARARRQIGGDALPAE